MKETKKLKYIHIYLPNIKKKCYNKEKLSVLERLLLTFNEEENLSDITKGDRIMEEYVKDAKEASIKDEVIGLYDKELHLEKLRLSELSEAKEEGIKTRNMEIAKNMLKDEVDISVISKYTGLSKEEIASLK